MDQERAGLTPGQVIDMIFRDPSVRHGLTDFADLGPVENILQIGKASAVKNGVSETRYYVWCMKRKKDIQIWSPSKSNPEEIVRQLWLHKLSLATFCHDNGVRQGYIPMFLAGFAEADIVGTCEKLDNPEAPVWSKVREQRRGPRMRHDRPRRRRRHPSHIHTSVGLKEHSATAHTSTCWPPRSSSSRK